MAMKAQPVPEPPYNWSGLYVGANFGGAWTNGSLNIPNNNFYGWPDRVYWRRSGWL
jgi:hypothetical protein